MRKMCVMLALLACLAGCGVTRPAGGTEPAATEPSGGEWGVLGAESVTPVPMQTQTQAPEETPEPKPASLAEICPEKVTVWLDGVAVEGLARDGAALVEAGQWTDRWSWFRGDGDGKTWSFTGEWTDEQAKPPEISCVEAERFSGVECVYYSGDEEEYWIPAEWVALRFGYQYLEDPEQQAVYVTPYVDTQEIPTGVSVPVLMYHAVSDDLWGIEELFVSPDDMRAQLEYLTENGYDPIFFSDLSHLSDYDKPVILTLDDGYDDNYTELFPLLQEYDVKATVFVITGFLGTEHYMTADQAREMSESGLVDIQSHTVHHPELEELDYDAQKDEISQSRLEVARVTGRIPYVLAYPSGSRNDDTLSIMPDYYALGVDMNGGTWVTGESWYKVDRIYISRMDTLDDFAAKLS